MDRTGSRHDRPRNHGLDQGPCIYGLMDIMDLHAIRLGSPHGRKYHHVGHVVISASRPFEDIRYEAIVNTVPQMKFGIAFNEASGACLTRVDGNDDELKTIATNNAIAIGAGHLFVIALRGGFPINIKNRILETPEVCNIFCATANPVEVIVAQTEQGRGVLGVIDGSSPKGIEAATDVEWRHGLLRKIRVQALNPLRFTQDLARIRDQLQVQKVSAAIVESGHIVWRNDSATTPFPIASVTKTMTAVLIMQLVEEGRLSLDLKLRQILSHTADGTPG